jgi:outer membrane protein
MRFEQQIWALVKGARRAALVITLSAFGGQVFASGQQPADAAPQTQSASGPQIQGTPAGPGTGQNVIRISAEEAVRMALENNLGVRAEKLNPQIQTYGVAQARAAFAPNIVSTTRKSNNTNPTGDFFTGATSTLTSDTFSANAGIEQLLPWAGGQYSITWDASRQSSSNPTSTYNPQLGSGLSGAFVQPLLRNFTIDSARQAVLVSQNRQEIADVQLKQTLTQTSRVVRNAYYDLLNAIAGLQVSQQSLELAQTSLKNNQRRVEVGTMAPIDIVQAQAEVAAYEESVIVAEGQIRAAEDRLRTLVMNPSQPDFWSTRLEPSEQPTLTSQPLDVDAAIANALANRTDIAQARKQLDQIQIGERYFRNQQLPALNLTATYDLVGTAGTQRDFSFDPVTGLPIVQNTTQRAFSEALRDVFGNQFRSWSFRVDISYPLGRSPAEAALAANRLQREQQATGIRDLETQVVASVREAGRQVATSLKRVESTKKARELAEQSLQAEEKRLAVGLSDTYRVLQLQRDLARQRVSELNAVIAYNRALIDFEAVQQVPLR